MTWQRVNRYLTLPHRSAVPLIPFIMPLRAIGAVACIAALCAPPALVGRIAPATPRLTLGITATAALGNAPTGSGLGMQLVARWDAAPGFAWVGTVGHLGLGQAERRQPDRTWGVFNAATGLQTMLVGAERERRHGAIRPYLRLMGGVTRVSTEASYIGYEVPAERIFTGMPEFFRFRSPISWGTVTRFAPSINVGGGTRLTVARRVVLDASINRFDVRRTTWAVDPQIGIDYCQ